MQQSVNRQVTNAAMFYRTNGLRDSEFIRLPMVLLASPRSGLFRPLTFGLFGRVSGEHWAVRPLYNHCNQFSLAFYPITAN
jgi:hypothetical protein